MARDYDPDIERMLELTDERSQHMGAQFRKPAEYEPVQFEESDYRQYHPTGHPLTDISATDPYTAKHDPLDIEMGRNRTRIGDRSYGSIPMSYSYNHLGEPIGLHRVSIPTESGWHADITEHSVQPIYYDEEDKDRRAWEDVQRRTHGATTAQASPWDTPNMRIGMEGKPWAVPPESMTKYPTHRSETFLNEQGMQKAIEAIGRMPRPTDMGPPRRWERE